MAMRYIIRRPKPEDLTGIRLEVPKLDAQLEKPGENFRRVVEVRKSAVRSVCYQFITRKVGADWVWICPSVEFVAENERGLLELTDKHPVPRPAHLGIYSR